MNKAACDSLPGVASTLIPKRTANYGTSAEVINNLMCVLIGNATRLSTSKSLNEPRVKSSGYHIRVEI
jgi:hypothetical protein